MQTTLTQEQQDVLDIMTARLAAESNDYVLSVYAQMARAPATPLFAAIATLAERRLSDIRHNACTRCW